VIDAEMIRRQVEQAVADIDVEAIRQEAQAAMEEARRGLAEGDLARLQMLEHLRELGQLQQLDELQRLEKLRDAGLAAAAPLGDAGGSLAASFDAPGGVRLVDISGDIVVEVRRDTDKVRLEVDGNAGALRNSVRDGVLTLVGQADRGAATDIRLYVPEQAALTLAGMVGDVHVGAGYRGDLNAEIRRGDLMAESVGNATIKVTETGAAHLVRVDGKLSFAVYGNGDLMVERAGESAAVEVMGRGDIHLVDVAGPLSLAIPGHADVRVERVDGPARIAFMGAGDVEIHGGASELDVAVMGSGNVAYHGTVDSPSVLMAGSGSVTIEKATGTPRIQRTGPGTVSIGE